MTLAKKPPGAASEEAQPIGADSPSRGRTSSSHGVRWSDCPSDDQAEGQEISKESSSLRASGSKQRPPGVWHHAHTDCEQATLAAQHAHGAAWPVCHSVTMIAFAPYGYPYAMANPTAFGTPMAQHGMPECWGHHGGHAAAFSSKSTGASSRQNHKRHASQDSDKGDDDDLPSKRSSVKNGMSMQEIMETLAGIEETRVVIARRIKQLGFKSGTHLRRHFQEQGAVEALLVSHSHLQTRVRPASLAFAIMATEEGATAVLAQGSEQVVKGVTITLSSFRRPERNSRQGSDNDSKE